MSILSTLSISSGAAYYALAAFGVVVILYVILKVVIGIVSIGSNEVGIIEKKWNFGKSLSNGDIIALNGEPGYQPNLLRTGLHFLYSPVMYRIAKFPLITVPQGKVGYIFARGGHPLGTSQTLGKEVECNNYQDVKAFFENGGQKGPQRAILREGTYAINVSQFIVITEDKVYALDNLNENEANAIEKTKNDLTNCQGFNPVIIKSHVARNERTNVEKIVELMGLVTVKEGPSLPNGVIIAPTVADKVSDENFHNNFQLPEKFLVAGGFKGLQHQVLTDGMYYINRLFADVIFDQKTIIGVGSVGVVNSYYGEKGIDISGDSFTHGELVEEGFKGIWNKALAPGKYAFNLQAGEIIEVPTKNVIIKWNNVENGDHRLDTDLKDIGIITKDAFECLLPLTVVFHIIPSKAPKIIQKFGEVKNLVTQCLDPMISGYFKNCGQQKTLLQLIQDRNAVQKDATDEMKVRFSAYELELDEVLIGTPKALQGDNKIEDMLTQLRERQIAKEKMETFKAQKESSEKEMDFNKSKAAAEKQADLTNSEIQITIQENQGKAQLLLAKQNAEKTKTEADAELFKNQKQAEAAAYRIEKEASADAMKTRVLGEAEANKTAKVGYAKALAQRELVNAFGGASYQMATDIMTKVADAIKESKVDIVPKTVFCSGSDKAEIPNALNQFLNLLLANMTSQDGAMKNVNPLGELPPEIVKMKEEILKSLSSNKGVEEKGISTEV